MKLPFISLSLLSALLLAACSGTDVPDAAGSPDDVSPWQPAVTRALVGDNATLAGFASAEASAPVFSADVQYRSDNRWHWQTASYTPPLSGIKVIAASIPAVSMTQGTTRLSQSSLAAYSAHGLMLGAADYTAATTTIPVHQQLACMDISCKGNHWLNTSINLYLESTADVDFRRGTLTTNSSMSYHSQSMTESSTATLTIFPQTFRRGNVLFSYHYNKGTYSYRLKQDYVVGANQCLSVKIASGDEHYDPDYTPPANVEISVTSTVAAWEQGSSQSGSAE
ncbi:MAG: fimbrillin family protein [Bacteroides sp.]|nr:fimbrillin family protein [Bacteroides sp.]